MTADEFINAAIDKGQSGGAASLDPDERLVYLIAEAEASCDMDGIDTLLNGYGRADLDDCAAAFDEVGASGIGAALRAVLSALPARDDAVLGRADALIKGRVGYDYDAIRAAVDRRLARRGS
ncbi:MAG TPA: hypothetical protein VEA69_14295 [Tepidisphaeraceae bacterium]|nr:hypothetical protein [Tepidisphaeraceae bacterium]